MPNATGATQISKGSFVVTVQGLPGAPADITWAQATGGDVKAAVSKWRNGGDFRQQITTDAPEVDDLVLTRVPSMSDLTWVEQHKKLVGRVRVTVSKQPLDSTGIKVGKPITYPNCVLVGVSDYEVDWDSIADKGALVYTFATSGSA